MRILKFKGKTEEIVLRQIEKEYGQNAVIIHTQKEEKTGFFKWFKSPRIVVTAAIKEESDLENMDQNPYFAKSNTDEMKSAVNQTSESEGSYQLLSDLKQELGALHQEIGELKREPKVIYKEKVVESSEVNPLKTFIQGKLMNLGLKKEVCDTLLETIDAEDSETFIRKLYQSLEELLIENKQEKDLPQIIFFIGSTGVGKTTTIAKLTAKFVLDQQKKVVLFTSDTYRIAAVEQLKTYADILGVEIEIIYDESELTQYIEKWKDADHILIDTAGRSHKNEEQVTELRALIENVENKQVYLVLNANTAVKDVRKIVETYERAEAHFDLIVTKLDETDELGNVINISYYANKPIAYVTMGQNVPADIEQFNKETYITELIGRLNDES